MKDFFKTKARIVTDEYNGYEAQFKPWWCPFYFQGATNTHPTIEAAERYINKKLSIGVVVKQVDIK